MLCIVLLVFLGCLKNTAFPNNIIFLIKLLLDNLILKRYCHTLSVFLESHGVIVGLYLNLPRYLLIPTLKVLIRCLQQETIVIMQL